MLWGRPADPDGGAQSAASFEPSLTLDHETAALRNRLIELEHSSKQAIEAARRQAYTEGSSAGRSQAQAECEPVLAKLAVTLTGLADLRSKLRDEAESDVVQLSLAIAKRILHRELSVDPGAIQALVKIALERLSRQEVYRVRVHPAQSPSIRAALADHHREYVVEEDARLESGSLVFETNRGRMDASVTAQFEEIERGLTDRVQQR